MAGWRRWAVVGLLSALGITSSCSSVDGSKVTDGDITADIRVSGGHHGSVSFEVGLKAGRHDVDLTGDAHVVGETSDLRTTLDKGKFLGQVGYRGIIYGDTGYAAGEKLTVRIERGDGSPDAVSTATLPEDVEVTSPVTGRSVSRSSALTVTINRAPGAIQVSFGGDCVDPTTEPLDFADGQPVVVPAGSIRLAPKQDAASTCPVQLVVQRRLTGDLSPDLEGGTIVATTMATVDLTSTP